MRAYDIILKKRNGGKLSKEEIHFMIDGFVNSKIPDYQMAAFLMAVYFRRLDEEERAIFTEEMLNSGDRIDLSQIPGIKIDKHSTGGVGDKTSIIVCPIVASLGIPVAKMAGRGLGHTGGTIDKLESIPGFRTSLTLEKFCENVKRIGIAIAGQTANLVPADKKIYALRDATTTVDEVSLIASSVMSKKLAGGADGYVLDVKVGKGAFMKTFAEAKELAEAMVGIAKFHNKKAVAVLTNMDQPLGKMVGNSLEVLEAINVLRGENINDLLEISIELSSWMCYLVGVGDIDKCKKLVVDAINNGKALEKFKEFVIAQGGNREVVENPEKILPISKKIIEFKASSEGYITEIDAEKIGTACNYLGAGRKTIEDSIDHSVGIELLKKIGDYVNKGETIAKLYISTKSEIEEALRILNESFVISEDRPELLKYVLDVVK